MNASADQKLEQITDWLKENLKPTKLYLYGSRANGNARADSDYDFVALVPDFSGSRIQRQIEILHQVRQALGISVQVWIYDQDEFDFRITDFGSIPETAVNTGREIEF